jgi:hypothetical protein
LADPSVPTISPGTVPAADVSYDTVAGLPAPPNAGSLRDVAGQLAYGCVTEYARDTGLRGIPVAGPGGQTLTEIVRVHGGAGTKSITAVSLRVGGAPPLPHWDTQNANEVLTEWRVVLFSPGKLPDGSPVRGRMCFYLYTLQVPPGDNDLLDEGANVVDTTPPSLYTVNPADFLKYLVGPSQPVTAPAGLVATKP